MFSCANRTWTLGSGARNLVRCDRGAVVGGIVDFVLSQRRSLRWIAAALNRAPDGVLANTVMLANGARCFASVHPSGCGGGALTVARIANEHRAIAELKQWVPDQAWTDLAIEWRPSSLTVARAHARRGLKSVKRLWTISRRLNRRYGVFHAYRVIEFLFYYQRYVDLFATERFQLAVMSSHSNPHGVALNAAARRAGVPVILITHGMPIEPIARLDYDLAIMECDASVESYRRAGCRFGHVIVKSHRRRFATMAPSPPQRPLTVGIFLSKDPTEDRLMAALQALRANAHVKQIVIRPHPVNLWTRMRTSLPTGHDDRIRVSTTPSIVDDLRACDVVLAANSTVHVEALVAGKPSCYVQGLDHAPFDVQSFVRDGLVFNLPDLSLFDTAAIWRFYTRPDWQAMLRRYADVDHTDEDVACAIRAAIQKLTMKQAA